MKAASTLGLNAQVRGDTKAARRYFAYSQALSRRDLQTQLWAIEDAVGREDMEDALHHYDVVLRASSGASDLLYPILTSASSDPAIRSALVRTLADDPIWRESFVTYLANTGQDPRANAMLFLALTKAKVPVPDIARISTVNALLNAGMFDAAWSYYATVRPGVDRRRSRDPGFALSLDTPTLFDWVPRNDGGVQASIHDNVFDFAAPASVGGTLLQQTQLLPAGRYRLSGHSDGIEQSKNARPYWELTCRDGRQLVRVALPASSQNGGAFAGQFDVPSNCPVQMLSLMGQPSDSVAGLAGRITRAALVPLP